MKKLSLNLHLEDNVSKLMILVKTRWYRLIEKRISRKKVSEIFIITFIHNIKKKFGGGKKKFSASLEILLLHHFSEETKSRCFEIVGLHF
jgi:hypothetical protein